jgi:hypothetical protein
LLTIEHNTLNEPIRVASDAKEDLSSGVRGVKSNGNEFVHLPFDLVLPDQDEGQLPRAKLRIDNVNREIVKAIRQTDTPAEITIQIVLSSDTDLVEVEITKFELTDIVADALTVEGELTTKQFDREPYPAARFTPSGFPALF